MMLRKCSDALGIKFKRLKQIERNSIKIILKKSILKATD